MTLKSLEFEHHFFDSVYEQERNNINIYFYHEMKEQRNQREIRDFNRHRQKIYG